MSTVTPSEFDAEAPEVVERKGLGHPDTLADGIAELASIRYSQYCLEQFGAVLHHNLDKVTVLGGRAVFRGTIGHYVRPVRVLIGGRASFSFAGREIPVSELLAAAAHEQLRLALPGYDHTLVDVRVHTSDSSKFAHWFHPRGVEDLPERERLRCNDSAYLVACAPRTRAELATLLVEAYLAEQPWSGSDIKVLTLHRGNRLEITTRVPAVVGQAASPAGVAEFRDLLDAAETAMTELITTHTGDLDVTVGCNTTEHPAETLSGDYVTVSGSALDFGEDGMTGRGNARHGLITPGHGDGVEATWGKNPTYHVGKVGAWLADHAAAAIAAEYGACQLRVAWRIGTRFDEPALTHLRAGSAEVVPQAIDRVRDVLTASTSSREWLDDLVHGECYRPRLVAAANWAKELGDAV